MSMLEMIADTVSQLNAIGESAMGMSAATFSGNENYWCIQWCDIVLWDSEGNYRDDRDYDDDESSEPTVETCLTSLVHERDELSRLIEAIRKEQGQ